ncbi:MAG: DUF6635 family protein [Parahaliea sp.]
MNPTPAPAQQEPTASPAPEALLREAFAAGAARYISGCEARIDDFVRKHYSVRGALRIHARALGWDIVRVPVNIVWSLFNLLFAGLNLLAGKLRLWRLRDGLRRLPRGLQTDTDRELSWLVLTELLRLPCEYKERRSERDALMEEIVGDPALQQLFGTQGELPTGLPRSDDFRLRLAGKLAEYSATRTGSAELASNTALLVTSKLALGQAAFGTFSAGTVLSAAVAHSVAVSNFWLGSTIGAYYYAVVPAVASLHLQLLVTLALSVILALVSTFIGILTDPLQARLGLHQKRLRKLVAALRDDLQGSDTTRFALREKYMGRLFDVMDWVSMAGRAM